MVLGYVFGVFFPRGKLILALLKLIILLGYVDNFVMGQFCWCSKCSRVKTGVKGCLPEETWQNKKVWMSYVASDSHGCVLWRLLSYSCRCMVGST